jgi:hypothetical protein
MSIVFPNNPAAGDTFTDEGRTFVWTGDVWLIRRNEIPWATPQQAIEGTRADLAMSPSTAEARISQIVAGGTDNPLSGTPTNMLASRAQDIVYQNTFSRPMIVSVWGNTAITLNLGATQAAVTRFMRQGNPQAGAPACLFGIVPAGWFYSFTINATAVFSGWVEYR